VNLLNTLMLIGCSDADKKHYFLEIRNRCTRDTRGSPNSIPSHSMWDDWWTKWHRTEFLFLTKHFTATLSVLSLQFILHIR